MEFRMNGRRYRSTESCPPGRMIPLVKNGPEVSLRQAKAEVEKHVKPMFRTWTTLNAIVLRHEDTLRRRWKKLTGTRRKNLLLTAWPDMPEVAHPDVWAGDDRSRVRAGAQGDPNVYKWPHITWEGLRGSGLLILLNSRARNLPERFCYQDFDSTYLGRVVQAIEKPQLRGYLMYLQGQTTPSTYGSLEKMEVELITPEMTTRGAMTVANGLLVLEIQDQILHFLLQCCYQLLQERPRETLCDGDVQLEPEPIVDRSATFTDFAAVAAETPYRLPSHIDLDALITLIESKKLQAEDHVWDLREDPGYFASVANEYEQHVDAKLYGPKDIWPRVFRMLVRQAYDLAMTWSYIHRCMLKIREAAPAGLAGLDPTKPLPPRVEEAILKVLSVTNCLWEIYAQHFNTTWQDSPGFRSVCIHRSLAPDIPNCMDLTLKESAARDPFIAAISLVLDVPHPVEGGMRKSFHVIQTHMDASPEKRKLLSPLMLHLFSDLALFCEFRFQLWSFYPWASGFASQIITENREPYAWDEIFAEVEPIYDAREAQMEPFPPELEPLVVPLSMKLRYPVSKRPSEVRVQAMRKAEANLDAFWQTIDEICEKKVGKPLMALSFDYGLTPRALRRTAPWQAPVERVTKMQPQSQPQSDADSADELFTPTKELQELSLGQEGERLERYVPEPTKAKVKTRKAGPEPAANDGEGEGEGQAPEPEPEPEPAPPAPRFVVNRRAFKVFRAMFFMEDEAGHSGELPWADFKHALTSIGFTTEKQWGSAWRFTPTGMDVTQSFSVHEPHPSSKFSFTTARNLGRRLSRQYGWTGETFVSGKDQ